MFDQLYLFVELVTTVRVRPLGSKSIVRALQGDTADKKNEGKEKNKTESTPKDNNNNSKDKDLPSGETKDTVEPTGSGNNSPSKSATLSSVRRSFDKQSKDGKGTNPFRDSKEFLRVSKDNKSEFFDAVDSARGDTEEDIVEMCSGWVMIPIVAALRDPVRKKKIEMYGGTPFAVLKINKKEVPKRPGDPLPYTTYIATFYLLPWIPLPPPCVLPSPPLPLHIHISQQSGAWNGVKRLFGRVQTRSKMEIIMTSVAPTTLTNVALPKGSSPLVPANRLTSLLPPNVVLPTSALSLVGIYRTTLAQSFATIQKNNDERALPQTGAVHPLGPISTTRLTHFINPPSQCILSTHPFNQPS